MKMKKSIKFISILLLIISFTSCDSSSDDALVDNLVAQYTYVKELSPGKITLINTSENADSYEWDFGDGTKSSVENPVKVFSQTGNYLVKLTAKNNMGVSKTFSSSISVEIFNGGLVINGDFTVGVNPWTLGVANPIPTNTLVTNNGNTYFTISVNAVGNPFDVNLSQKGISMTQGKTYRLTFDAWSSLNRPIVVGIGLSGDPWTNQTVSRNLTTTLQNFSIDLVANFTNANSRVIFDMGAALGTVNIDNVTLNQLP
jgi:PKD repeat protein